MRPGEEKALASRLKSLVTEEDRPVAFITGSGISLGAIDGVASIIDKMRASLGDPDEIAEFDRQVTGPGFGEKYQQAALFLEQYRGQDRLNYIIRLAVLTACPGMTQEQRVALARRNDEKALKDVERDASLWKLTPAVEALGGILHLLPEERRGPVITTNFDPLLEIAVRKAGARANPQYIDLDGEVSRGEDPDAVDIVHVHGFWRSGDTLHTVSQLQKQRPQLDGSLRESLRDHTVVVIGYSGWDDAFSRSLRARVGEKNMVGMDLIWCSYEALTEESFGSGLLSELSDAPRRSFYHGVDANRLFPQVLNSSLDTLQCPLGWTRIVPSVISDPAREPSAERVVAFFDGAEPDWALAVDPRIPKLSTVTRLTEAVGTCIDGRSDKRIVAAVGPMGEGKTMALRQAAVDVLAAHPDTTVYWRDAGAPVDPEAILAVPSRPGRRMLLVSDDGALVVDGLRDLMRACRARDRSDVFVLLAAQEREWRSHRAWPLLGEFTRTVSSHGLTDDDGALLVAAWEDLGVLGELAHTPARERVSQLVRLSAESLGQRKDSSLVGAMLQLRYGPLLSAHVEEMLLRLDGYPPVGSGTLRESFLMIALLHGAFNPANPKSRPLTERILARALDLNAADVDMTVKDPLGKEAAVSGHGDHLWVRHLSIAEAALRLSRQQRPDELSVLIGKLVTAAVSLSAATARLDEDLYAVAYLSGRLQEPEEAVVAAEAATRAAPTRLSYRTSHITTLRVAGRPAEGLRVAERTSRELATMADLESKFGFLTEWGTSASQAGHPESNVLLTALALGVSTTERQVVSALLSIAVPLTTLHENTSDPVHLDAVRGVVGLVGSRKGDSQTKQTKLYLARHNSYISDRGQQPLYGDDAWNALQAAVDKLTPTADAALTPVLSTAKKSVRPGRKQLL